MTAFNNFLQKYGSVMMGYSVLGLPVFGKRSSQYASANATASDITQDYVRNSSLLINLSKAIGRIVTSYEAVQRLAGYTQLVGRLQDVLDDLHHGKYDRQLVNAELLAERGLQPGKGERYTVDDYIEFDRVSIITPNGDILKNQLSFRVNVGDHLMIVGPNGCGKSSMFRILGGLWPSWDGKVYAPPEEQLYYIPQKPYLVDGTFRDQIIYPDGVDDMKARGKTDEDLMEILRDVGLAGFFEGRDDDDGDDDGDDNEDDNEVNKRKEGNDDSVPFGNERTSSKQTFSQSDIRPDASLISVSSNHNNGQRKKMKVYKKSFSF
ncbi:hypothetical protein RFI_13123 [Reticulomyxa filosa]|uniref:ABC transporter domain-containing protein n=1 Tax=Reticulomyxa filosa TaxID=46433 RepID=X6NDG5_RETFI|nr:hypothetical protein RFI_13123 [Reticulomyxa filosa]|eukprot:ETO24036.1 hypothetical protein RFI_13123 [Reticulomyxa filosa]